MPKLLVLISTNASTKSDEHAGIGIGANAKTNNDQYYKAYRDCGGTHPDPGRSTVSQSAHSLNMCASAAAPAQHLPKHVRPLLHCKPIIIDESLP